MNTAKMIRPREGIEDYYDDLLSAARGVIAAGRPDKHEQGVACCACPQCTAWDMLAELLKGTPDKYILNEHGQPVLEPDLIKWAKWFQNSRNRRIVKQEHIGDAKILTVFLSVDHALGGEPPCLWETMVFGGPLNQEQDRCGGTRQDAEAMHIRMVEEVKAGRP